MAIGTQGHTLSGRAIRQIGEVITKISNYPPKPPRVPRATQWGRPAIPFRAVVVGIDLATWGGARKRLAVQVLRSHPFGYGGPIIYVDGWYDSMIDCGQEILVVNVQKIEGDPLDAPAFVATPMFATDQHFLVEPDPQYTAYVADPLHPVIANPCPIQP